MQQQQPIGGNLFTSFTLPPSQSALLVHCPCVSRILTIYSYVATLARIIHGKFNKSRRTTKMKLRPIKFVHIKYKISQVTNFECPPSPLSVSFLWLSLIIVFGNQPVQRERTSTRKRRREVEKRSWMPLLTGRVCPWTPVAFFVYATSVSSVFRLFPFHHSRHVNETTNKKGRNIPPSCVHSTPNNISDCCEIRVFSAHWHKHRQKVNEIALLIVPPCK